MSGWITLNRDIQQHWLWGNPEQFKAWCAILMAVNWERREIPNGGKVTICERGQCIRSLDQWASIFGKNWNKYKVRRFLKLLQSASMIRLDTAIKAQRLTVVNYSSYQDVRNDTATETVGQTQCKRNASATGKQLNKETNKQNTDLSNDDEAHPDFGLYSEGHTLKYNPMSDTGLRVEFSPYIEYRPAQMDVILGQLRHIISKTSLERTLAQAEKLSLANGKKLWIDEFMGKYMETQQCK